MMASETQNIQEQGSNNEFKYVFLGLALFIAIFAFFIHKQCLRQRQSIKVDFSQANVIDESKHSQSFNKLEGPLSDNVHNFCPSDFSDRHNNRNDYDSGDTDDDMEDN